MKKPIIWPHNMGSQSAKALAQALETRRVRSDGNYRGYGSHCVINWGNSGNAPWIPRSGLVLNTPASVAVASDKLRAFEALKAAEVSIPEFTQEIGVASLWALEGTVVGRSLLRASQGRGITLYGPESPPRAPQRDLLYVKYIKKAKEYRVHVFNGEVLFTQDKRKRNAEPPLNTQIRSHDNGYVFCREDIVADPRRDSEAIKAVKALGLVFGGVDLIYNRHKDRYFVLEVNTAVGLEGRSIIDYSAAIHKYCQEI